ncbi:MAG: hypothetical protein UV05_C0049G0004 [candidate division CPR1 bacterium GW2011_GWA2_42_17]|uniref:DNA recombination protein RmuC n=1 Tax=candidate division CPR1 bacterium GW2011_GWA2_42_17 TaxID=1618341 RepID=A0A0G0YZM1_9BACT|nr:MAG: hypothetical protein UV05_C0049G0004 [candidate division CPR1 bacterium GW2011_GWA2_42_17]
MLCYAQNVMDASSIIIIVIVAAGFAGLFWFLQNRLRQIETNRDNDQTYANVAKLLEMNQKAQEIMQNELQANRGALDQNLQAQSKAINERLDKAASVIGEVNKHLGHMQEIGRQMKDFSDFLRSPKLRGNVGEQVLKDLLEQVMPRGYFEMQYKFREGETVDAIIKTNNGLVPIDSKFPMESFQRAARAQEGTVDFAIMYVPSEGVYYEIAANQIEVIDFAANQKVYLVSPNNFYYFLKIIMIGLEGAKLQEEGKKIWETLKAVQHDAGKFGEQLGVLSRHVTNAKNSMDGVNSEFVKLSGKIENIKLLKGG